jgi:predicted ATP-grasp superfamily ATP-dependent carboligase
MQTVGYRGPLDLGYRFDARDGRYKLLDVNPRMGPTSRLFVAGNGLDTVLALYLDLTGQRVPAAQVPEGRKWIATWSQVAGTFWSTSCASATGFVPCAALMRWSG